MRQWFFLIVLLGVATAHANAPFFSTRFGNNGVAGIEFDVSAGSGTAGDNNDYVVAAALQPDGRMLLGGQADTGPLFQNSTGNYYPSDFAIGRLLANGQPDPSFGDNGRKLLGISAGAGPTVGTVNDLLATGDGKIIYAGNYLNFGGAPSVVIGRLLNDGNIDPAFNGNGRRLFSPGAFAANADNIWSLQLKPQPDGKILAAVSVFSTVANPACIGIARLLQTGSLDLSFGQGTGLVCIAPPLAGGVPLAVGGSLIVLADGRILVGTAAKHTGGSGTDMAVARLHADGSLDGTFGNNGWAFVAFDQGGALNDFLTALALDNAGRIVAAGQCETASGADMAVARMSAEGAPDGTFGTLGAMHVPMGSYSQLRDMAAMPDGRVLLAGNAQFAGNSSNQGVLVMLKNNGTLDSGFGNSGTFVQSLLPEVLRVILSGDFLYLVGNHTRPNSTGPSNVDFAAAKYLWNAIFADGVELFNPPS